MKYSIVLAIAGSDSCGGAGIQADIKAISATGSYAASAITAVTVQNTVGVQSVFPIPPAVVAAQIKAVLSDIGADAIKIGMLHSVEVIMAIKEAITQYSSITPISIVLDPVMISTSGHRLIEESAIGTLKKELIPITNVITPNIPEAEILANTKITSQNDLAETAKRLSQNGHVSVLMKAGHAAGDVLTDYFYNAETNKIIELPTKRCNTKNTHGTGCTLSSALASYLAQGYSIDDAASAAKVYISKAIEAGANYEIGSGHGPVCHFFNLNETSQVSQ
ncbi:MAG: bifunctional hydroxymethylpyrimidine kinase/phosphomethylpyrimidine kinase [Prevotellaceae bacterium]|nr:bifunctional hydroxymethylpyrimidine kinase/phosphomethylpyrimidine kinase [Prevotellaceae bacterium]